MPRTIPASEIKRRGISAVDELLCDGPVHVIKNDRPTYVILTEEKFERMVMDQYQAQVARVKAALEDVEAGRVTRYENVDDLIRELRLEK